MKKSKWRLNEHPQSPVLKTVCFSDYCGTEGIEGRWREVKTFDETWDIYLEFLKLLLPSNRLSGGAFLLLKHLLALAKYQDP